jgi:hypothetical protein
MSKFKEQIQLKSDQELIDIYLHKEDYQSTFIEEVKDEINIRKILLPENEKTSNENEEIKKNGQVTDPEKYKKIGGWLLVLCVILIFVSPITNTYSLWVSFKTLSHFFEYPLVEIYAYSYAILNIGLIVLSIRAGVALNEKKTNCIKTTKNYLKIYLAFFLISTISFFFIAVPPELEPQITGEFLMEIIRPFIFFYIWYSYLNKSERVRLTYSVLENEEKAA